MSHDQPPTRFSVWRRIVWRPWWRAALIALAVVGAIDTIQDQLIPVSWQEELPTVYEVVEQVFPGWPWWVWLILALCLLVVATLEGAYREIRQVYASTQKAPSRTEKQRRAQVENELENLSLAEKRVLQNMLVVGRPKNIDDQTWQSLTAKTSFLDRDFVGPKGIKDEFRPILEKVLSAHEQRQRKQGLDLLAQSLKDGTLLRQRRVQSDDEYTKWKHDLDRWVEDTARILRDNIGQSDEALFMMLESALAVDYEGHYNPQHNTELMYLEQRLKRLREIITEK